MGAKFKLHGHLYEPSCDGADKNGYIHFYEVIEASSATEAIAIAKEDYGDYNTVESHGEIIGPLDEQTWLARNGS